MSLTVYTDNLWQLGEGFVLINIEYVEETFRIVFFNFAIAFIGG